MLRGCFTPSRANSKNQGDGCERALHSTGPVAASSASPLNSNVRTQKYGARLNIELTHLIVMAVTLIVVVAIIGFTVIGKTAFSKVEKGAGKSFGLLFQRGNFLRITTVVLVVLAAMFLALAGKLNEGVGALLSGVAGMALGGLDKAQPPDENKGSSES